MHATSHQVKSDDDEIKAKQGMATSIGGAEGESSSCTLETCSVCARPW